MGINRKHRVFPTMMKDFLLLSKIRRWSLQ